MELKDVLKFYPNFPSEGINFVDIMPFLQDREVFRALVSEIGGLVTAPSVAAPEARAFLFSAPLLLTGCGVSNVVPFRKKGKLPHRGEDLQCIEIMKEYGPDRLYFRKSDIAAGTPANGVFRIAVLDDVLATGGTAEGIARKLQDTKILLNGEEYGIEVAEFIFIAELDGLNGRGRLSQIAPVHTVIHI